MRGLLVPLTSAGRLLVLFLLKPVSAPVAVAIVLPIVASFTPVVDIILLSVAVPTSVVIAFVVDVYSSFAMRFGGSSVGEVSWRILLAPRLFMV